MVPQSTCLPLTPREWEILSLLAEGYQQTEVAQQLIISPYTVKSHAHSILIKLSARNMTHAVCVVLSFSHK